MPAINLHNQKISCETRTNQACITKQQCIRHYISHRKKNMEYSSCLNGTNMEYTSPKMEIKTGISYKIPLQIQYDDQDSDGDS